LRQNRLNASFPIFTDPREALRALAHNRDWQQRTAGPFADEKPDGLNPDAVRGLLTENAVAAAPLDPASLARILTAYGIPLVPWETADSEEFAVQAATHLGLPVVMKTASPEILHKSDVGGVLLNLQTEAEVCAAYHRLLHLGGPGVLLQKMADAGLEWFVGGRQDGTFGPIVVLGLGGIYVEILRETGIRVAPIDRQEAARLVDECRAAALLGGARGQPEMDRDALLDVVVRISWLLYDFPRILELDLNPLRVLPKGQGCAALDWRAMIAPKR
jgi:acetyltransferase